MIRLILSLTMLLLGGGAILFAKEAQEVLAGLLLLVAALVLEGRIQHGPIEDETSGKENQE